MLHFLKRAEMSHLFLDFQFFCVCPSPSRILAFFDCYRITFKDIFVRFHSNTPSPSPLTHIKHIHHNNSSHPTKRYSECICLVFPIVILYLLPLSFYCPSISYLCFRIVNIFCPKSRSWYCKSEHGKQLEHFKMENP